MDPAPPSAAPHRLQIAAAVVGNALEWYDFVVFGFFTTVISPLFFPNHDPNASLLLTMATFGAGFVTRPLGGIVLGLHADRRGRKAALQLIISLMTLAVALIAFAPTYASIGLAAPALILAGRLLQGFATGGEFASATSFLVESAPPGKRGFYGSLQMVGQGLSALAGALAGVVITQTLDPESISAWGWRLPFALGLVIGPVGLFMRKHLDETQAFTAARRKPESATLSQLVANAPRRLASAFGMATSTTIYFYILLIYMPTYGKTELGLALRDAFLAQGAGLCVLIALTPVFGALSDRIGRRPVLLAGHAAFLVILLPLFAWVQNGPTLGKLAAMQSLLCVAAAMVLGPISTALADQFPVRVRSTGLALAYNLAVMTFGGFAQLIVAWLIETFATPLAPGFYLMFGAFVGFVTALATPDVDNDDDQNAVRLSSAAASVPSSR